MNNAYFVEALAWLINTLFGLYILVVLLRLLLQWVRASFYNPVAQFIVKVTNPPLKPLRRIIPGFGGIDFASITLLVLLQAINLTIVAMLLNEPIHPGILAVKTIVELLSLTLNVFLFSILIQVILSWVNPGYNPATALLFSLNEPLLAPARRLIPPIAGIDLSPIAVIILLQLLKMLLIPSVAQLVALF